MLKGYAPLSIKTWERCESCRQGGILKKKLTEKGSVRLPDPPNRTLDLTGGQTTWRDVVALTRVMGQMDLDGCARGRGRREWSGTGDQRGAWWRGRREGGGEISRLQASVEPCDGEHCELEEKLHSHVWIYLHPTAEETKLSKNMCSGQSMHPLFDRDSVCCGCGLSALGFSFLMPHNGCICVLMTHKRDTFVPFCSLSFWSLCLDSGLLIYCQPTIICNFSSFFKIYFADI